MAAGSKVAGDARYMGMSEHFFQCCRVWYGGVLQAYPGLSDYLLPRRAVWR